MLVFVGYDTRHMLALDSHVTSRTGEDLDVFYINPKFKKLSCWH